jgi:NADPH:quinone reductase-like Zn-dependent oxidoreductase
MKQIVRERYGSPEVLSIGDAAVPGIGDDGVLVRVRASSVNALDWHHVRGRPLIARLGEGLLRPRSTVPGVDLAGVIEAVGAAVTELRPGDEVFGARNGAFAEYVAARVRNLVPKPANLTFEQAAAIPVAATTALQALRDAGRLEAGQRVLVIGAGGGVGTFAVQIGKALGATVSAATSTANLDIVRSLGADEVIDYAQEDVLRSGRRFDLILDVGGYRSLGDLARASASGGTVVSVGAGKASSLGIGVTMLSAALRTRLRGQRMPAFLARINRDDLVVLGDLAARGAVVPVIDRAYPLRDTAAALRYVETGQARGKVVITI